MDDLLKKTKMDNKYKIVCLVIKRVRQLIKEKEKNGLFSSDEKITSIALREIEEGKLKKEDFIE